MRRPGFTGRGFYQDKLMLGPGGSDITISANSCVFGVPGFSALYSGGQDIIARNITINSHLLASAKLTSFYYLFKVIASGTVTLNSGGLIRTSGDVCAGGGVWDSPQGCVGYVSPFRDAISLDEGSTLGGSGDGGSTNVSGPGNYGQPPSAEKSIYWGGSGGTGKVNGGSPGGSGGICIPNLQSNNFFQPSVYLDGIIYTNVGTPSLPSALFPYRICGGGGGGGSGDDVSGTGGGAAGGGVCWVTADKLVFNGGSIDCNGGYTNTGGGGGGGGLVILNVGEIDWASSNSTIFCTSGASGEGDPGSDGTVLIFSNDLIAKFTGNVTKAIYDAAVASFNAI